MGIKDTLITGLNNVLERKASILSGCALVGLATTTILSSKAGSKAAKVDTSKMTTKEKVLTYGKIYAGTVVSATATAGCIIASDKLHVNKEITLAAKAGMWMDGYAALKRSISKRIDEKDDRDIAYDSNLENLRSSVNKIRTEMPDRFNVYEPYTGQIIEDVTTVIIMHALLKINESLCKDFIAGFNDWISLLGGKKDPSVDKFGWAYGIETQNYTWSYYGGPWIDILTYIGTHDGKECIELYFTVEPNDFIEENFIENNL